MQEDKQNESQENLDRSQDKTQPRTFSEDISSLNSVIFQACQQRKQESYKLLKTWEKRQFEKLSKNKEIVEKILQKIDKKVQISQSSIQQITNFFKERKEQELNYSKKFSTKQSQLSACFREQATQQQQPQPAQQKQPPAAKQIEWYPTLTLALKGTDLMMENQGKNVQNLVNQIEKNILKDQLLKETEDYTRTAEEMRGKISEQMQNIEKLEYLAQQRSQKYQKLVNESKEQQLKKKKTKDLFTNEKKYTSRIFQVFQMMRNVALEIIKYWEKVIKLEEKRMEMVKSVFVSYINLHQQTYGSNNFLLETVKKFQNFCFSVEKSFGIKEIVCDNMNINNFEELKLFINEGFQSEDINFNKHPLVQKKYYVKRDVGIIGKNFKESLMILTVDDMLLLFDQEVQKEGKSNFGPNKKFHLQFLKIKERKEEGNIDIIEDQPGLFNSSQKALIRFEREIHEQTLQKTTKGKQKEEFYCKSCRKEFANENSYKTHLESKKHKENEKKPGSNEKSPQQSVKKSTQTTFENQNICLFCDKLNESIEKNVEHMSISHGFFICEQKYCVDIPGLLKHLGEKINKAFLCILCENKSTKDFQTGESVKKHMIDKGHCFMQNDIFEEYEDFYDFSEQIKETLEYQEQLQKNSTKPIKTIEYVQRKNRDEINSDEENEWESEQEEESEEDEDEEDKVEENKQTKQKEKKQQNKQKIDEEWEDEEEQEEKKEKKKIRVQRIKILKAIVNENGELELPNGKILGHRSLRTIYKQYYRPMYNNQSRIKALLGDQGYQSRQLMINYSQIQQYNSKLSVLQHYRQEKKFLAYDFHRAAVQHVKDQLVLQMFYCKTNQGEYLMKQNDSASTFFILQKGSVSIEINNEKKKELTQSQPFGELALLYNCKRSASCFCLEECYFWAIDRDTFRNSVQQMLKAEQAENREFINTVPFFHNLSEKQKDAIAGVLIDHKFNQDQIIINENDQASSFYIIKQGSVAVIKDNQTVRILQKGDSFGETALLEGNNTRAMTIKAIENEVICVGLGKLVVGKILGDQVQNIIYKNMSRWCLEKQEFYQQLKSWQRENFIQELQIQSLKENDIIARNGENKSDYIIIVLEGQLIYQEEQEEQQIINKMNILHFVHCKSNTIFQKDLISYQKCKIALLYVPLFLQKIGEKSNTFNQLLQQNEAQKHQKELSKNQLQQNLQKAKLEDFICLKKLGYGQFGNVYLVRSKDFGGLYSLKCISKVQVFKQQLHKHVLNEHVVMKENKKYIKGVELFDAIRDIGLLGTQDSQYYIASAILALEYLHNQNIIYRDLKPENIMVNEKGHFKLIDMGSAKYMNQGKTFSIIGTPHYMAPEVIQGKGYDFCADLWSLGVMLYEFLCGYVPFGEEMDDPYQIYESIIRQKKIEFPKYMVDKKSQEFIIQLLDKQTPEIRLGGSFQNLKNHQWFDDFPWADLQTGQLKAPYLPHTQDDDEFLELKGLSVQEQMANEGVQNTDGIKVKYRAYDSSWELGFS